MSACFTWKGSCLTANTHTSTASYLDLYTTRASREQVDRAAVERAHQIAGGKPISRPVDRTPYANRDGLVISQHLSRWHRLSLAAHINTHRCSHCINTFIDSRLLHKCSIQYYSRQKTTPKRGGANEVLGPESHIDSNRHLHLASTTNAHKVYSKPASPSLITLPSRAALFRCLKYNDMTRQQIMDPLDRHQHMVTFLSVFHSFLVLWTHMFSPSVVNSPGM